MKRPPAECKARFLALLRAQACARTKPATAFALAQAQHAYRANNGYVDDIAALRKCLAALIASKDTCRQPVRPHASLTWIHVGYAVLQPHTALSHSPGLVSSSYLT